MKILNIFLAASVALCLVSCEDTSDLGIAQVNPQLPEMSANGLTVALANSEVNLDENVGKMIPMVTVESMENLPEGATVEFEMQVALNEDFTNAKTLPMENGAVSADAWEDYLLEAYSKAPNATDNYVRFAAYVKQGTQLSRLGGADFWYLTNKVRVTPVNLHLDIEFMYYLVVDGQVKSALYHADRHPYDDPTYSTLIEVGNTPVKWMIAPESAHNGNASSWFGLSTSQNASDMSGILVLGGQEGVISAPGKYRLQVNMLDLTYTISYAYDSLNTPGEANGWDAAAPKWMISSTDYTNYSGYAWLSGEFKISAGSWDVNWGMGGSEGTLSAGGGNLSVSEPGLYYLEANIVDLTYSITKIESIGATGSYNGWDAGNPTLFTIADNGETITANIDFTSAGDEWKFVMNKGWDINLGGTESSLVQNGDNLVAPGAGSYKVQLNLSTLPYTYSVTPN